MIRRRLEGNEARPRLVDDLVRVDFLDDDAVARLVRGLERLLESPEAAPVEAEAVGHLVELGALLLGDDAVLDDLGEKLLVHRLELAEADVSRHLAELEPLTVLERRIDLAHPPSILSSRR